MKQIPYSLFEASKLDGARDFTIYREVVLPLSISSMAALAVLEFTWIWNDLLWALVLLQSDRLKPVTLGLANMQGEFITSYNIIAAGSLVAAVAPVLIFLLFQRFFIDGLTVGAEKG
jgi:multiple sugar transport system permease protein